MPAKIVRSAPRPPFGLPERPVMRRQLASVLWQGRRTQILTPVRESSGESRVNAAEAFAGNRREPYGSHSQFYAYRRSVTSAMMRTITNSKERAP